MNGFLQKGLRKSPVPATGSGCLIRSFVAVADNPCFRPGLMDSSSGETAIKQGTGPYERYMKIMDKKE